MKIVPGPNTILVLPSRQCGARHGIQTIDVQIWQVRWNWWKSSRVQTQLLQLLCSHLVNVKLDMECRQLMFKFDKTDRINENCPGFKHSYCAPISPKWNDIWNSDKWCLNLTRPMDIDENCPGSKHSYCAPILSKLNETWNSDKWCLNLTRPMDIDENSPTPKHNSCSPISSMWN